MKISSLYVKIFRIILVLSTTLCLSACQKEEQPLHYGGQLYAQEFLLQGLDVWSPYNLNVEHVLFSQPDDLVEGFLNGTVDIAFFSEIQAARIFSEMGDEPVIIATAESGDRISTLVRANSEFKDWEDLAGKKIALRSGSGEELAVKYYFSINNIDWDAFEWFNLPVDKMPEALAEGAMDAITALEPIPAIAQVSDGMDVMQSYGDCCPTPMVLVTTNSYARDNPEKITNFLRGHLDKLVLIENNPIQAARTASEEAQMYDLDISASVFYIVFKRVDFSMQINNDIIFALKYTTRAMHSAGVLEDIPEFRFDTSYLKAVIENK